MIRVITLLALYIVGACATCVLAQSPPSSRPDAAEVDLDELARSIASEGTNHERATRLVRWMADNFEWTYTDYQQRTVEEIVARSGGNCAEQARVLGRFLEGAEITSRWAREINIHPRSDRRKSNAEARIGDRGNRMSVFGYMHNDHRWLEIYDDRDDTWFPADPTMGIFGLDDWVERRLGFMGRHQLGEDQLAPFVVQAGQPVAEDRTEHYLIDAFNAHYDDVLETLPAWADWTRGVRELAPLASRAFAGEINLHQHTDKIETLEQAYLALMRQYLQKTHTTSDWIWTAVE